MICSDPPPMIRAALEEIDKMSLCPTRTPGTAGQAGPGCQHTGTGVNRPQLDQLERLTISFIRSHVGSMGLLPISSKF